jgi:hypothetical protein
LSSSFFFCSFQFFFLKKWAIIDIPARVEFADMATSIYIENMFPGCEKSTHTEKVLLLP